MPKRDFQHEDNQEAFSGLVKRKKKDDSGDVGTSLRKLERDDYTVGWICALKVEYVAAQELLDEEHERLEYLPQDNNNYTLGSIGKHNVVIATLPLGEYGIASAATVARDMMHSFHNVRIGLMVGIGGGVPSENHDIRLGDIVVSSPNDGNGGLFQYDFGRNIQDQSFQPTGFLNQPPVALRTALAGLQAQYDRKGHQIEQVVNDVLENNKRLRRKYSRPDQSSDRLYQPEVVHPNTKKSCVLTCDPYGLISRPERDEDEDSPAIHYGLIASANQLMKNALLRDKLAAEKDVLCFEMEAAGLMNHFPCLVIRGICDYADSHKNEEWQGYAAMVAAAYAKDLLYQIAPNSVTAEKRIRDILSDMQEVVTGVGKDVHKLVHKQHSQEHQAVLDWLTPVDYALQHNDFISRRQEGTGLWLIESAKFQAWLKTNGQTLFCPGIPGAGKTIITAMVVNHLLAKFRDDPNIGIAYVYCNFQRQHEQTAEKLLTNVLKQLAQTQSPLPKIVEELYDKHKKSRTRPSLDETTAALHSMAAVYSRSFIIIGALDECQDLSRSKLLDEIFNLQTKIKANIFATSRINDNIRGRFEGCATTEISAADRDVLAYLDGQISLRGSDIVNGDIQDKIRAGVLKAAGGMFLLATFHIDTIMSQPTRGEIKEILQKLGSGVEGLHEIYKQAMERIEGHREAIRFLAKRVLTWITHAKRPLSITEIQHALAVREHMTTFDSDYMPDVKDLRSVCAGLVTTDEESGIIRLVHYTTQEFFQQTQEKWFPEGKSYITKICVTYLSFNTFDSANCQAHEKFEQLLQSNPFYGYAASNWGHHAREASIASQEIMSFLKCKATVEASSQALMEDKGLSGNERRDPTSMTGLHLAAYFGVERAVDYLLQTGDNPDLKDIYGRTPLSWAAENGHVAVVAQLLATRQAEVESRDRLSKTPLLLAIMKGHIAVIRLLLDKGANPNSADVYGQTPLSWAAEIGDMDIARLLLSKGADFKSIDGWGKTPAEYAAESGHSDILQLLFDKDVDLEVINNWGQELLWEAANRGHEASVQLLLSKGADLKATNSWGQTLLLMAAMNGHIAVVQLLLDKGVGLEVMNKQGQTLLLSAVENGRKALIQLLLDKDADLEIINKRGQTFLSLAAENGHMALVQLLLDKGADLETIDNLGQTPLSYAVKKGHITIIQLLLDKGANLKRMDDLGQTPLSYAAKKGYITIIQLLLDKGAGLEAINKRGQTLLSSAAENGHMALVQLLLDKGADLERTDDFGQTPLSLAAENGHKALVQLLLNKGADPRAKDNWGMTPLSHAAENGHEAIIWLLHEKVLNLTRRTTRRRTTRRGTIIMGSKERAYRPLLSCCFTKAPA